eukprot:5556348-Lingulodinium_polyedra.AAC.1
MQRSDPCAPNCVGLEASAAMQRLEFRAPGCAGLNVSSGGRPASCNCGGTGCPGWLLPAGCW